MIKKRNEGLLKLLKQGSSKRRREELKVVTLADADEAYSDDDNDDEPVPQLIEYFSTDDDETKITVHRLIAAEKRLNAQSVIQPVESFPRKYRVVSVRCPESRDQPRLIPGHTHEEIDNAFREVSH